MAYQYTKFSFAIHLGAFGESKGMEYFQGHHASVDGDGNLHLSDRDTGSKAVFKSDSWTYYEASPIGETGNGGDGDE